MAVPQSIFDKYNEVVDSMISNDFGINCTVYWIGDKVPCQYCSGISNIYSGPSFNISDTCTYCGGSQYKQSELSETIKLRVYFDKKYWIKMGNMDVPDGSVQIIGFLSDYTKVRDASYIILNSDSNIMNLKYKVYGELQPHGFKKNRYFIGYLSRHA